MENHTTAAPRRSKHPAGPVQGLHPGATAAPGIPIPGRWPRTADGPAEQHCWTPSTCPRCCSSGVLQELCSALVTRDGGMLGSLPERGLSRMNLWRKSLSSPDRDGMVFTNTTGRGRDGKYCRKEPRIDVARNEAQDCWAGEGKQQQSPSRLHSEQGSDPARSCLAATWRLRVQEGPV